MQVDLDVGQVERLEIEALQVAAHRHAVGRVHRTVETDVDEQVSDQIAEGVAEGKERTVRVEDAAVLVRLGGFTLRVEGELGGQGSVGGIQIRGKVDVIALAEGRRVARARNVCAHSIIIFVEPFDEVLLTDLEVEGAETEVDGDALARFAHTDRRADVNGVVLAEASRDVHVRSVQAHAEILLKDLHRIAIEGEDDLVHLEGDAADQSDHERERRILSAHVGVSRSDLEGERSHAAVRDEVNGVVVVARDHEVGDLSGLRQLDAGIAVTAVRGRARVLEEEVFAEVLRAKVQFRPRRIVDEDRTAHGVALEGDEELGRIAFHVMIHSADRDHLGHIERIGNVVGLDFVFPLRGGDHALILLGEEGEHVDLDGRRAVDDADVHVGVPIIEIGGEEGPVVGEVDDLHERFGGGDDLTQVETLARQESLEIE